MLVGIGSKRRSTLGQAIIMRRPFAIEHGLPRSPGMRCRPAIFMKFENLRAVIGTR